MKRKTVLVCGIPSEPTTSAVINHLARMSVETVVFNQREVAHCRITVRGSTTDIRGALETPSGRYDLRRVQGAFLRLMDYRHLPELEQSRATPELVTHTREFHETIDAWANLSECRVLNRPASMVSNASKPFQAQLLRDAGFTIPATLVTDDPRLVVDFRNRHGRLIYKSVSSTRSIVRLLTERDMRRIDDIRSCPTQFQQYIEGFDLRVHTIGDHWLATSIHTSAVDYRYASRDGLQATMAASSAYPELGHKCALMARRLGLALAGFDFRITGTGEAYCLEVNPMPLFGYYEARSGQPLSRVVAGYLSGGDGRAAA